MNSQPSPANPMLIFGCGNMGRAMLDGWLASGITPASFVVVDPGAAGLPAGVAHYQHSDALDQRFAIALLAVKPQMISALAGDIQQMLAANALVISILAGTRIQMLEQLLPECAIVRLMPNLAAALGKSPLGLWTNADIDHADIDALLAPLGSPFWLASEQQMDAVTALAGSGPAFVYRFMDALAQAGESLGLDPKLSQNLAVLMVQGAADLANSADASPQELARRVTSPGGTTAAGLAMLDDQDALKQLIAQTLTAARDRGVELSKG
jgi:pyrroline-5-carboxylate reductase